jgi:hypothetical protein
MKAIAPLLFVEHSRAEGQVKPFDRRATEPLPEEIHRIIVAISRRIVGGCRPGFRIVQYCHEALVCVTS